MDIKKKELTRDQMHYCIGAIGDVWHTGKTERVCPACKRPLHAEADDVSGSGEVWCESPGCFGKLTLRGI